MTQTPVRYGVGDYRMPIPNRPCHELVLHWTDSHAPEPRIYEWWVTSTGQLHLTLLPDTEAAP